MVAVKIYAVFFAAALGSIIDIIPDVTLLTPAFRLKRKAGWAHSGIMKSVINFARRQSCGKQREMKK
jgi:hypothetical protein